MTSTQDETGPDDGVVLVDDLPPEERLEIIGELLHQIEDGLLAVAGDISYEDIELLAFVYGLAGLPDDRDRTHLHPLRYRPRWMTITHARRPRSGRSLLIT